MEGSFSIDAEQTNQHRRKAEMSTQESASKPQQLIKAVSYVTVSEISALHRAAKERHTDALKELLERLAPDKRLEYLKATDRWGIAPLHWAARYGHDDTVKVLLKSLAQLERLEYLNAKGMHDRTALHLAAGFGHTDTVNVLFENMDDGDKWIEYLKVKDAFGRTAFHLAAGFGHTDTVEVLLKSITHGETLEYLKAKDEKGRTTLHSAVSWGHTDTVEGLLEIIAPDKRLEHLKAKDNDGRTALHCAAWLGRTDTVKVLLESLAPDERLECLKAKDECGRTTLHWAAMEGRTDTVKVLLESFAPDERLEYLKANDEEDRTTLHLAAWFGRTDTVKVLLESLAPDERLEYLKAKHRGGWTALHWAAMEGRTDTVKVLLETIAPDERLECLKAEDGDNLTALHLAAERGHTDTVMVLLENLAPDERLEYLKVEDRRGKTALHLADERGHTDTVKKTTLNAGSAQKSSKSAADGSKGVQGDWKTVGKIMFNRTEQLGHGCDGTFVYKGKFESRDVAVKRILYQNFVFKDREILALVESDCDPNIIRYYGHEWDQDFFYVALELCAGNLQHYVDGTINSDQSSTQLLHQAMSGIAYLHSIQRMHRDIKPENVLISNVDGSSKVKIADFGLSKKMEKGERSVLKTSGVVGTEGWNAPEMYDAKTIDEAIDIFSAGCVICYVVTKGKHPFGEDKFKRRQNILEGKHSLEDLQKSNVLSSCARDLVQLMICGDSRDRPSAGNVLKHPFFWSVEKQYEFFEKVYMDIQKEAAGSDVIKELEKDSGKVIGEDWKTYVSEPELNEELKGYKGTSLRELLRAIRNKTVHYVELPDKVKQCLGTQHGWVTYFTTCFPHLLLHVYSTMIRSKDKPTLHEFY